MKKNQGKAQSRTQETQETNVVWLAERRLTKRPERKKTPKPRPREVDPTIDTQLLADLFPMPKE
jgi:hypothetical protein